MWGQVPEMVRAELSGTVLRLKALGVDNMMTFDWLAPPPAETMVRALELLHALGALDVSARWACFLANKTADMWWQYSILQPGTWPSMSDCQSRW